MYPKPKKSLGQNFLVDKNIQRKIICACEFSSNDTVLEIGAGRAELTSLIAQSASKVYSLELDPCLCVIAKSALKDYSNVEIINEDILKFNPEKYLRRINVPIKVVGNIPYYISSPVIEYLLGFRERIKTIFLTVQKEFGERVAAPSGSKDYASFSCFVQYYCETRILFLIKRNSFFPSPKVDSCFLRLDVREKPCVKVNDEEYFFKIIRAAFNQRRKILKNSVSEIVDKKKLDFFFTRNKIAQSTRPEMLTLSDFANLANL